MRPLRSIRWRLLAWYGLLLAFLLGALDFTSYQTEKDQQDRHQEEELRFRAEIVSRAVRPESPSGMNRDEGPPRKSLRISSEDAALFTAETGYYYVVWLKNGLPTTRSPSAPPDVPQPTGDEGGVRSRDGFRELYLIPAPQDVILVGCALDKGRTNLAEFTGKLVGFSVILLIFGMVVGWWLVSRALRPIQNIAAAAIKISEGNLAHRIDTKETESELGELVGVLNSTFARLESVFSQQAQFTADAAHELRTPITIILTHAQNGLASEGLTEEQREAFDACQRAAQRMRRLVESLLQLARFDSGQEPLQHEICDLAEIVREGIELVQPLADAKQINFNVDLTPAPFRGDADRIGQVITNLLANAIHYNHSMGQVRITTRRVEGFVLCEIADNGPGISEEHLLHIFDRFYRVDKARTSATGRTGLGLAISKTIVDAAGGTITAQSTMDLGATFTVRLPE